MENSRRRWILRTLNRRTVFKILFGINWKQKKNQSINKQNAIALRHFEAFESSENKIKKYREKNNDSDYKNKENDEEERQSCINKYNQEIRINVFKFGLFAASI